MVRYQATVEVTHYFGSSTPRPTDVRFSVRRVAEPPAILRGAQLRLEPDQRGGFQAAYYEAVKDAQARGEVLAFDDVRVELELVQVHLKRGKADRVQRSKPIETGMRDVFDEIMARPQPLQ
jgi:hypothetical protein